MALRINASFWLLLIPAVFTINFAARSQNPEKNFPDWSVGVYTYYGFVLRHSVSMGKLSESRPWGAEVHLQKRVDGSQLWHHDYRFPDIGYTLGWMDFRNPALGHVIYSLAYLEKPVIGGRHTSVRLKIGTGAAFTTRPYDPETNFQNIALSSRLNYALRADLALVHPLSSRLSLSGRLVLSHFSNGAYKQPNAGINIPSLNIGAVYRLHPGAVPVPLADSSALSTPLPKITMHVASALTIKETGIPGGKKYPGAVISAYINRRVNRKSALNIGMDGFYNTAVQYALSSDPSIDPQAKPDIKRAGITVGHELYFGQFSLLTQLGGYVYRPYKTESVPVYQRYMLKYAVSKRVFGGVALKAHYGSADCVEWQLGINL